MTYKVTIFQNIKDTETPFVKDIDVVFKRIREGSGATKDIVKKIRLESDKAQRQELKKQLPAICFSGVFNKRTDNSLINHSGLICLDFDGYETRNKIIEAKHVFSKNKYTFSVFISPSGKGLKVLIKIPEDPKSHQKYFHSLEKYFNSPNFDKTGKNISRVCYESYDPLIIVNENSEVWDIIEEIEYTQIYKASNKITIPIRDKSKIIEILLAWWKKKYPLTEGRRNENAYILAMAFNDFGINRHSALDILKGYAEIDFTESEIEKIVFSAYKHKENFGTKYYEDEEMVNSIRSKLKNGASREDIRIKLMHSDFDSKLIESVLDGIEEDKIGHVFWKKSDKGVIKLCHLKFKEFLEKKGFYKYIPEGGKSSVFIKIENNLIDNVSEKEIKDFTLKHLLDLEDINIYNYFADNTRFFKEEFLSLLSTIDLYFITDEKDTAYLYYKNYAVKITKNTVTTIDYLNLGGYVWKGQIINRDFNLKEISSNFNFKRFINNINNNDNDRIQSMESAIGFLLHSYKNLASCPAIILNDEIINDNPAGGTGKGLLMASISKIKKMVFIDGKSFNFEKSFPYQLVTTDTQIICFDDISKHFNFERLFSVITEGLTLEKKNKDAFKLPFNLSPKIAITTNYVVKGEGNSFLRRKWELELHSYYKKDFTPVDEFGELMFENWDDEVWSDFDNYMIKCLKNHLSVGIVRSQSLNSKKRKLSADTCYEFVEWCGLLDAEKKIKFRLNVKLYKNDLHADFINEYPDYGARGRYSMSRIKFYRWIDSYIAYEDGLTKLEDKDHLGRWIIFNTEED